jgi:hypothetical protein
MTVLGAFGIPIVYPAAGMKTLYNTVRQYSPSNNAVFVDSNNFASDRKTFDAVCATATPGCVWQSPTNLVYVLHYYDCQPDQQKASQADCGGPTPETCATINGNLSSLLADRAKWPAPVDFDEFGWPQGGPQAESTYVYGPNKTPINIYNHGLFRNNVIAYLDAHGMGWGAFAYGNDVNPIWQGPYNLDTDTTTVPWSANADGQAVINDMQGTTAQCTDPPSGYG